MIYEIPLIDAPIRQGDIFIGLPRVDLSLRRLVTITQDEQLEETTWQEAAKGEGPITAVVPIRSVAAIVATQDCDALRSPDITLCEIRQFRDVERKSKDTQKAKKWVDILTQHARINQKWFYLPPDPALTFTEKMAVDFLVTIRLPREELEEHRSLRRARLNSVADEHFRERISEFFRRYPYDEWYSLNKEELEAYQGDYPDVSPFPWQTNGAGKKAD